MEVISLKMEKELLEDIDKSLKKNRYSTRTEFIRDAIRRRLTEQEKEEAIKKLEAAFGSMKSNSKFTDEETRKLAGEKIAKKYGFKLD